MKKLTTISLFIFWMALTATLAAGLIFFQNNKSPANGASQNPSAQNPGVNVAADTILNLTEIARHNTPADCWLLISNKVYNVTSYLGSHPGGAGTIIPYCGADATLAFATKDIGRPHSSGAAALLTNYYIGDLNQTTTQQQIQQNVQNTKSVPMPGGGGRNGEEFEDD
jgi:cytochrome b involved in lipid metabolism